MFMRRRPTTIRIRARSTPTFVPRPHSSIRYSSAIPLRSRRSCERGAMPDVIRFYTDVHGPRSITLALRRRGIDVLTAQDRGLERAKDNEHLKLATREGR